MKHKLWITFLLLAFAATSFAGTPLSKHVVLVVEENHSYESVMAKGGMPYLKSLGEKYTVLVNYYANHHPSIGNYFTMTTGQTISTDDDFSGVVRDENIVTQLSAANKKWKIYGDSLPQTGYIGGNRRPYVKKHFPMAYFANVRDDQKQRMNLVPAEQFMQDLKSSEGLPEFSMIIPNLDHDAHDGSLQEADNWLKQYIEPLLQDPNFQKDGILIVTFDEAEKKDKNHGGGHITTVVIGPLAKEGFRDDTFYQHQSLLATLDDVLGLPRLKVVENAPAFNAFK